MLKTIGDVLRREAFLDELSPPHLPRRQVEAPQPAPPRRGAQQVRETTHGRTFMVNGAENERRRACAFCDGDHAAALCKEFRNPAERRQQAQERRLCFNCLKSDHYSRECPSRSTCRHCERKHHSALCTRPPGEAAAREPKRVNFVRVTETKSAVVAKGAKPREVRRNGDRSEGTTHVLVEPSDDEECEAVLVANEVKPRERVMLMTLPVQCNNKATRRKIGTT